MEFENSKYPATGAYPKTEESIPRPETTFLNVHFPFYTPVYA
jgi:hypothetical protein